MTKEDEKRMLQLADLRRAVELVYGEVRSVEVVDWAISKIRALEKENAEMRTVNEP